MTVIQELIEAISENESVIDAARKEGKLSREAAAVLLEESVKALLAVAIHNRTVQAAQEARAAIEIPQPAIRIKPS